MTYSSSFEFSSCNLCRHSNILCGGCSPIRDRISSLSVERLRIVVFVLDISQIFDVRYGFTFVAYSEAPVDHPRYLAPN